MNIEARVVSAFPAGRGDGRSVIVALGGVVVLAATWLLVLAVVGLDLTGCWPRGPYFRWQGLGLLVGIGANLLSSFAQLRGMASQSPP